MLFFSCRGEPDSNSNKGNVVNRGHVSGLAYYLFKQWYPITLSIGVFRFAECG